jgi:hypothetical protein
MIAGIDGDNVKTKKSCSRCEAVMLMEGEDIFAIVLEYG